MLVFRRSVRASRTSPAFPTATSSAGELSYRVGRGSRGVFGLLQCGDGDDTAGGGRRRVAASSSTRRRIGLGSARHCDVDHRGALHREHGRGFSRTPSSPTTTSWTDFEREVGLDISLPRTSMPRGLAVFEHRERVGALSTKAGPGSEHPEGFAGAGDVTG
jgi:hypothetical protein